MYMKRANAAYGQHETHIHSLNLNVVYIVIDVYVRGTKPIRLGGWNRSHSLALSFCLYSACVQQHCIVWLSARTHLIGCDLNILCIYIYFFYCVLCWVVFGFIRKSGHNLVACAVSFNCRSVHSIHFRWWRSTAGEKWFSCRAAIGERSAIPYRHYNFPSCPPIALLLYHQMALCLGVHRRSAATQTAGPCVYPKTEM